MPKGTAHEHLLVHQSHAGEAWAAATANGASVDAGRFSELLLIVNAGTVGASATVTVHLEDSDDNTTFADITGATTVAIAAATDDKIHYGRLNLIKVKRYVRAVLIVATATSDVGVVLILSGGKDEPVTQAGTEAFDL